MSGTGLEVTWGGESLVRLGRQSGDGRGGANGLGQEEDQGLGRVGFQETISTPWAWWQAHLTTESFHSPGHFETLDLHLCNGLMGFSASLWGGEGDEAGLGECQG